MKATRLSCYILWLVISILANYLAAQAQPTTATPVAVNTTYTVVAGDTLYAIAIRYNTTVSLLKTANQLTSDLIKVGQRLTIPGARLIVPPAFVTTTPAPTAATVLLRHAVLFGDLAAAYPASLATDAFILHYSPGSPPALSPQTLSDLINAALTHHQQLLGLPLAKQFDVYVAGALFAPPDQALRGRSFSGDWRIFFLNDGTDSLVMQQYLIAHELTHLATWQSYGIPHSIMLSEGAAVYVGMDMIGDANHLSISDFCLAYQRAGQLPHISRELSYRGHIRNLENYYAAGCFVQYLVDNLGIEKFAKLYPSGRYATIYGKSLVELEAEWMASLANNSAPLPFQPLDLIESVNAVKAAHQQLFSSWITTPAQVAAYREISAIWGETFAGRLDIVKQYFGL